VRKRLNVVSPKGIAMKLSNIRSTTVALFLATFLLLLVGTYTENAGFQWAGVLLGLVTAITAVNQARSPDDGKGG
jgi:succinate-acetate transporter protein